MPTTTDWRALLGNLHGMPEPITYYRWPYDPRTTPGAAWVDQIHDATWEGEDA
ncbi:hypothetical protein ACORG1_13185 [Mycobacterium sp. TJFP1]